MDCSIGLTACSHNMVYSFPHNQGFKMVSQEEIASFFRTFLGNHIPFIVSTFKSGRAWEDSAALLSSTKSSLQERIAGSAPGQCSEDWMFTLVPQGDKRSPHP